MDYKFTIRILNKRLRTEKTIAAKGADRFAEKRVKELESAISMLNDPRYCCCPRNGWYEDEDGQFILK